MSDKMSIAEEQVSGLIDLVLDGQDPEELINSVFEEINEGPGNGPYHIGSKVKINTGWSGEGVDGRTVSVSKGDVVSVVMANLGEEGQDRMVLLSDGKTRVVVPYAILGEGLEEQESLDKGPKGHEVPPAKGKLGGVVRGKAQGDNQTPEQIALRTIPGSKKPLGSIPGTYTGRGKPKDSPTAQMMGMLVPSSISGKTVEDVTNDVLSGLESIPGDSSRAEALSEMLIDEEDEIMFAVIHEGIFGEGSYTIDDLVAIANMMKARKTQNNEEGYTEEDIDEVLCALKKKSKK